MSEELFEFGIATEEKIIAVFRFEPDRDRAMIEFEDWYSDCEFESVKVKDCSIDVESS